MEKCGRCGWPEELLPTPTPTGSGAGGGCGGVAGGHSHSLPASPNSGLFSSDMVRHGKDDVSSCPRVLYSHTDCFPLPLLVLLSLALCSVPVLCSPCVWCHVLVLCQFNSVPATNTAVTCVLWSFARYFVVFAYCFVGVFHIALVSPVPGWAVLGCG